MDKVIKEGTLRVLISESTCDVILSCKDHRLMAHKLILSIASPVFRELLRKNPSDSTSVIIIPDISGSIMSILLDYIYTGTTVVYSNSLQEFLSAARFLQISVDSQNVDNVLESRQKMEDEKKVFGDAKNESESVLLDNVKFFKSDVKKQDESTCGSFNKDSLRESTLDKDFSPVSEASYLPIKAQKRLPDLLPISSGAFRRRTQQRIGKVVVPSPWCTRSDRSILGDPRAVSLESHETETQTPLMEDTNNNFQPFQNREAAKSSPKTLDTIIRHLYLNSLDSGKELNKEKSCTILGENLSKNRDFAATCNESNQKDLTKTLAVPEPTNLSFSRSFSTLSRLESNSRLGTTTSKSKFSDTSDYLNNNFSDSSAERTFVSDYSEQPSRKNILSSDFAQNLSLSRKLSSFPPTTPATLPPSTIAPHYSPTILNIPIISPLNRLESTQIEGRKLLDPSRIDSCSNSNDNSNFDETNENFSSNESSNDEKKEEEAQVKKKAYKCEDCGKTFSQLRNYKYHRSVHEGTKEFSAKCSECGKMFNDRGYLSSHMKIHRDKKEYACPHCPKRFNQRVAYNMHLRIHTGVKPHECPTCGKSFSRKMLLKQHQRVHTGERPYICPECGKTFADRSNMSLHARLHTGVKPYACNLCPKSFTKKHHLKTHMNFHTGLKPYTCENCGLAFSQSSNMRTHYKKCILKGKTTKAESVSSAENNSS